VSTGSAGRWIPGSLGRWVTKCDPVPFLVGADDWCHAVVPGIVTIDVIAAQR